MQNTIMNRRTPTDVYPLSPMQQGMLLHYLKDPGAGTDIEQIVCTLAEEIASAPLRQAWQCVVQRHPVLRTTFRYENGEEPAQAVYLEMPLTWEEQDWRSVRREDVERSLKDFLTADRHRQFNLSQGPLLRLTLIRISDADYRLVWTFHHILMDGRSFPLVLTEVFNFYEAIRHGLEITQDLPRPYRDYIGWLHQQDLGKGEAYWREQLAGFTNPTRLAVEAARHSETDTIDRQGDERLFLSTAATSTLLSFAKDHGLTLNTLVQAAWALLLSRYSGEDDVLYGVVRAGRKSSIAGADEMLGLFMNTLPFRVRITQDSTVLDWLRQLRAQWMALRDFEHTPLVQAQRFSAVPSGISLFDSILMFDKYQLDELLKNQGGKWANRSFRLYEQTGYPITLTVYSGTALCLQVEFDCSQFRPEVIHRMLGHLRTLLEAMPEGACMRVGELPMLTPEEVRKLTIDWNETGRDYSRKSTVHELFELQARRSPEAVAIVYNQQQLTYAELNRRANQLARLLQRRNVKPDMLVGLCLERSLEMVVAVLGILKAGGAYVPLDPAFPKERLGLILKDSHAGLLVTQREIAPFLPEFSGQIVYLEDAELSTCLVDDLANGANPDNLAYVIFTSGSTGRPKGVQIEHRSVVNFLESMKREPGLTADDVLVAVTTLSFDIAGLELFLPLIAGARVVVASREAVIDGRILSRLLDESNATIMQATPTTWRLMVESGWKGRDNLKILCGGEALPPELAEELLTRCSSLWNVYGPTETTIWSTVSRVISAKGQIPLGKPIANTQVFILDRELQPVPIGVTGELYIGGDGLARGYLNRPDLTAERFVPNPYSGSVLMYKTGDLCRWRPDGSIECLGRNDHQVKIRGHRIELGDIESALSSHPDVKQAVVSVQERGSADKRLVAYVVANSGNIPPAEELRRYLTDRLPEYMVPAAYVEIPVVPLTPNGKIDRKALPSAGEIAFDRDQTWRPLQNETERIIAAAWSDVLGAAGVGNNSNFFDLGGDSLLMIRVRGKLEHSLHCDLPIIEMFRHPTVGALANYLSGQETSRMVVARSRQEIAASRESARRRLQLRKSRSIQ